MKILDTESLMSFPSRQHLSCCNSALEELSTSMWFHWERTLRNLRLVASWLGPMCLFPVLVLALHSFTVVNLSCEYYMLTPVSSPSKSSNLGMSWRPHIYYFLEGQIRRISKLITCFQELTRGIKGQWIFQGSETILCGTVMVDIWYYTFVKTYKTL